jgi:hypothetical protein
VRAGEEEGCEGEADSLEARLAMGWIVGCGGGWE